MFTILSVLFQNVYSQVADLFSNVCIDLMAFVMSPRSESLEESVSHCKSTRYVSLSALSYDAISAGLV